MEEVENKSDRTNSLRHYDHPYFFNPKVKKIKKKKIVSSEGLNAYSRKAI